jgi:hypothetical protein
LGAAEKAPEGCSGIANSLLTSAIFSAVSPPSPAGGGRCFLPESCLCRASSAGGEFTTSPMIGGLDEQIAKEAGTTTAREGGALPERAAGVSVMAKAPGGTSDLSRLYRRCHRAYPPRGPAHIVRSGPCSSSRGSRFAPRSMRWRNG